MAITIEQAKAYFGEMLEQFRIEQKLLDELARVRAENHVRLRQICRAVKGLYFLTDEGIVYVSRVKGGAIGLRRAPASSVTKLRRDPGNLVDLRADPKYSIHGRTKDVEMELGRLAERENGIQSVPPPYEGWERDTLPEDLDLVLSETDGAFEDVFAFGKTPDRVDLDDE